MLRQTMGETQTSLATRLGMNVSSIIRWENRIPPTGEVLIELAKLADSAGLPKEAAMFRAAFEMEVADLTATAKAIRGLRAKLQLTQQEMASRLGISINSVYRYENNALPELPIFEKLSALAESNGFHDEAAILQRNKLLTEIGAFLSKAAYEDVWVLANLFDFIARGETARREDPPLTNFKDLPSSGIESNVNRMLKDFGPVGPLQARERGLNRLGLATKRLLGAVQRLTQAIEWERSLAQHLIETELAEMSDPEALHFGPTGVEKMKPSEVLTTLSQKTARAENDPDTTEKETRRRSRKRTPKKALRKKE